MTYEGAPLPPRLLRTTEAGLFLGLSGRTLEKHRLYGSGPVYRKIGGRVVYAVEDLQAWADRARQTSTAETRLVRPARPSPEARTFRRSEPIRPRARVPR
jgi:hypothetical protein